MITREQLIVGETYTDVGDNERTILCIGTDKVMYRKENGAELLADIEVMLDVLSEIE